MTSLSASALVAASYDPVWPTGTAPAGEPSPDTLKPARQGKKLGERRTLVPFESFSSGWALSEEGHDDYGYLLAGFKCRHCPGFGIARFAYLTQGRSQHGIQSCGCRSRSTGKARDRAWQETQHLSAEMREAVANHVRQHTPKATAALFPLSKGAVHYLRLEHYQVRAQALWSELQQQGKRQVDPFQVTPEMAVVPVPADTVPANRSALPAVPGTKARHNRRPQWNNLDLDEQQRYQQYGMERLLGDASAAVKLVHDADKMRYVRGRRSGEFTLEEFTAGKRPSAFGWIYKVGSQLPLVQLRQPWASGLREFMDIARHTTAERVWRQRMNGRRGFQSGSNRRPRRRYTAVTDSGLRLAYPNPHLDPALILAAIAAGGGKAYSRT